MKNAAGSLLSGFAVLIMVFFGLAAIDGVLWDESDD